MKASSKGRKLAAKRRTRNGARVGRPFVQGVAREPNGRISRAITPPEPADRLALEVRARMMGVSPGQARDARLSSYIGRLCILGVEDGAGGLSMAQYGAALRFLEIYNDWRKAIGSPLAVWDDKNLTGEEIGLTVSQATSRARKRYGAALKAIQEAQNQHPHDNLYASLQYLVIEDKALPHMVGGLRLVLNALARHFSCCL